MAFDAARYTTGMRYDPTLNTGRYPAAPAVGPLAPPTTDPVVAPPPALPTPPPAPRPPVSAGSVPLDSFGGEGMQGGGLDPLGGMPGPSPDQSLGALGQAALTGLGFAVSPMSTFAGMLASLAYDGIKGNPPGTTRGLLGIARNELGLTAEGAGEGGGVGVGDAVGAAQAGAQGDYGEMAAQIAGLTPGAYGGGEADGGGYGGSNDATGAAQAGAQGDYGGMAEAAAGMGMFQSGGYTGAGGDAMVQPDAPAGTVHEGEVVLSAPAVDYYGPELLLLLNDMAIPRSRLAALVQGQ